MEQLVRVKLCCGSMVTRVARSSRSKNPPGFFVTSYPYDRLAGELFAFQSFFSGFFFLPNLFLFLFCFFSWGFPPDPPVCFARDWARRSEGNLDVFLFPRRAK